MAENTTTALTQLKDTADLVQSYAKRIIGDERAAQFHTQISIMAKRDPKIRGLNGDSLVAAMLACIHLDLMPNTPEGLAYVIPYGNQAQFQVGYKGMLRLAHRSGQVRSVNAEVVYDGDTFDVELGTDRKLVHKPNFEVDRIDTKLITHAYAVIELMNGAVLFEVMTRSELDKIKSFAKASSTDAPWNKWYAEQAKKTVLKRAFKLIPSSTTDNSLALASQYDSWAEASKLKHDNGQIIEGETISAEEREEVMRRRIEKAEAERKAMQESDATPTVVEPIEAEEADTDQTQE